MVEDPEPETTWIPPTPEPVVEEEPEEVIEEPEPVVQPEPETIIEKKLITVTVYDEPQVTVEEVVKENEESSNLFMIIIPAICVGVLLIVAVMVAIHFCNKKRENQPVVIKEKIEGEIANFDVVDAQYVMDPDEKNNIFARPVATPGKKGKRVKIGVKAQDNIVEGRMDSNEDDGFGGISMSSSSQKFDSSSKSLSQSRTFAMNDTVRGLNDGRPSVRDINDA